MTPRDSVRAASTPRALGSLDGEELDLEDERRIRADTGSTAALAVSEGRRNDNPPRGSHRHELKRLGPALDGSLDRNRHRLAALVGAVDLRSADETEPVVAHDGILKGGRLAAPGRHDLVLESARERDDA